MTYSEWHLRPFQVKLRDPDGTLRVDRFAACIGPYDARSQAAYKYPLSEVIDAAEEGSGFYDDPSLEGNGR